jgi:chromosome segregation ATPase
MSKILVTIILSLACIGLVVALVVIKTKERQELTENSGTILSLSNDLTSAQEQIAGLNQVNLILSNNVSGSQETAAALSNRLTEAQSQLTEARTGIATAREEITNLNHQVSTLETKNKELEHQAGELSRQMAELDKQIAVTEASLAQSETNNVFLENELKKQVADRAALEHRFTDIAQVRSQLHKLKDESLMATRLRWMREGSDPSQQRKGSQLLAQHGPLGRPATAPAPNTLNVEAETGGGVRVVPSSQTNAP